MKGILKKEEPYSIYGFIEGLLPNIEYEILSVKNNCCNIRTNKFPIVPYDVPLEMFDITYEVGDMVKIIANKNGGLIMRSEIGSEMIIKDIDKFGYHILDKSMFMRTAKDLKIVKTKYQLEQEKKEKDMRLCKVNRNESKNDIAKNTNKHNFAVSNTDITVKEKDSDKVLFKGEMTTPIINHNIKAKEYKEGDILKVTNGKYKGLEGTFVAYVEGYDSVLIQTDELNRLYVNSTNIMLIKKKVNNTHKTETRITSYNGKNIDIDFIDNKTIVYVPSWGTTGEVICDETDEFNESTSIELAYLKAEKNYHKKAIKDCNFKINDVIEKCTTI